MCPALFENGAFSLRTYGVTMAVAFMVAVILGVRAARRRGIAVDHVLDLTFWILVASLLGARLLYVLTQAAEYYHACAGTDGAQRSLAQIAYACTRPLHLWEGGFVYYGGLAGGVLASVCFTRRRGLSFLRIADLAAPLIALGHFFGRLGCFAAGCCYGWPTRAASGIAFPPESLAFQEMALHGLVAAGASGTPPLHPTQLYEALAELAIFVLLLFVGRVRRAHGQVLATYLILYPVVRFVVELFRGDPGRRYLLPLETPGLNELLRLPADVPVLLSTSQLVSLLILALGVTLALRLRPSRTPPQPA